MPPAPSDRLACRTPGCPNTIQAATAARNDGYCGPCAGRIARAAREAYVRANRKDLDRFAGVTDPVELLRLMHTPPKPDPLVNLVPAPKTFEELYLALTPEQARRLMMVASELLLEDAYQADDIAKCLAAFTDFKLDQMLDVWLDHDRVYPALIFRGAGGDIRDRLLRLLRSDLPTLLADHALSALAWIGDETVIEYLQTADVARPEWAAKLYLKPTEYARVAGWELVGGERRQLISQTCLALHVGKERTPPTDQVCVMRRREELCPWCGCKLVNLVEIHARKLTLDPLHGSGERIEVVTCAVCSCFAVVYAELDGDGYGQWSSKNVRPDHLPKNAESWELSPWSKVSVGLSERRPTHAADWCLPTTLSQIGGFPAWVQDIAYPACVHCKGTMSFIAQIDQAVFPMQEGVYYAFICGACRTTATTYQQT